ncbi:MAG: trimethylamine methyltransferase family protein [Anaerolineae bacterium]
MTFVGDSRFHVLGEHEIERIHQASLAILERTGIAVDHPEGRDLLRSAGAWVDGRVVHIPPQMVETALKAAPHSITLFNRQGKPSVILQAGHVNFLSHSDGPSIVDFHAREKRPFTSKDGADAIRVADSLPNIDVIGLVGAYSDVPPEIAGRTAYAQGLRLTGKPITCAVDSRAELEGVLEMAACVAGGFKILREAPQMVLSTGPTSPLVIPFYTVEHLFRCAELGVPAFSGSMPCLGATGPVTMAGNVALGNAESLASVVLSQLKQPGAPVILGGFSIAMDMRTMLFCYGAPESSLMVAAWTDMATHYDLPMWGTAGCTDSKIVDEQAVLESGMQCLLALLSGASLVHDVGLIESGKAMSLEMMVLADESIAHAKRIAQGVLVDDASLALETIHRVGPGGDFLAEEHTLSHFRQIWVPRLLDRSKREQWSAAGGLSLAERAARRTQAILEDHHPAPLPARVLAELKHLSETWVA